MSNEAMAKCPRDQRLVPIHSSVPQHTRPILRATPSPTKSSSAGTIGQSAAVGGMGSRLGDALTQVAEMEEEGDVRFASRV